MKNSSQIDPQLASAYAKAQSNRRRTAPRIARAIISVICMTLVALSWWASITEVNEIARAEGEIRPTAPLVSIEHDMGGRLAAVFKHPGDAVHSGDAIAVLEQDTVSLEIDQLTLRADQLSSDIRRLSTMLEDLPRDIIAPVGPGHGGAQIALASAQQAAFMSRRAAQAKRIRQYAEAVRISRVMRDNLVARMALAKERQAMFESLAERGIVSRIVLAEEIEKAHQMHSEVLEAEADLQAAVARHQDAQSAYDELFLDMREKNLSEIAEADASLAQTRRQLIAAQARLEALTLRAPVGGIIQAMHSSAPGEVIEPGATLASILPTDQSLVAEIKLSPRDVGHVAVGDTVAMRITSFDQKRFGRVTGLIDDISATTETGPDERPFFRVVVSLDSQSIGGGRFERPLQAGMVVNAEILTSTRTIAEYLLKPIERSLSSALGER